MTMCGFPSGTSSRSSAYLSLFLYRVQGQKGGKKETFNKTFNESIWRLGYVSGEGNGFFGGDGGGREEDFDWTRSLNIFKQLFPHLHSFRLSGSFFSAHFLKSLEPQEVMSHVG